MTIEADHYGRTRARLAKDPIVIEMAQELPWNQSAEFYHEDGTPTAWFMTAANREYRRRGGSDGGHMGAVAEGVWIAGADLRDSLA